MKKSIFAIALFALPLMSWGQTEQLQLNNLPQRNVPTEGKTVDLGFGFRALSSPNNGLPYSTAGLRFRTFHDDNKASRFLTNVYYSNQGYDNFNGGFTRRQNLYLDAQIGTERHIGTHEKLSPYYIIGFVAAFNYNTSKYSDSTITVNRAMENSYLGLGVVGSIGMDYWVTDAAFFGVEISNQVLGTFQLPMEVKTTTNGSSTTEVADLKEGRMFGVIAGTIPTVSVRAGLRF